MTKDTTIIRVEHDKDNPYTPINRTGAQDERLSLEARGALFYFLTKPDNWQANATDLALRGGCGKQRAYRLLKELELAGYATRAAERDSAGRVTRWVTTIYEKPLHTESFEPPRRIRTAEENQPDMALPQVDKPQVVLPQVEKPHHSNYRVKEISNTTAMREETKTASPGDGGQTPDEREANAYLRDVCDVKSPRIRQSLTAAGWTPERLRREWAAFQQDNARRAARSQPRLEGGAFVTGLADKNPHAAAAPIPEKPVDPMADLDHWRAMDEDEQQTAYRRYKRAFMDWKAQQPHMAA